MKVSPSRLFPLLLVLALALLSFWLERAVNDETSHPALRRHDPDYIVERFSAVTYDEAGKKASALAAERMMHYPDDDSTELVAPRVQQSRSGKPALRLQARRGVLTRDGTDLFLYDDVQLTRDAGAAGGETRLKTSFLHFSRPRSFATTDREVVIAAPGRSLRGRGMDYDGEQHRFVLRSQVRGRFEPRKNNS